MLYNDFVEVYEKLAGTTKRLEKTIILAEFIRKLEKGKAEWIYLLLGRVVPDYDAREIGISDQLMMKAISKALGIKAERVVEKYRKIGDLGEVAEEFLGKRTQGVLVSKALMADKVFENLKKILDIEGKGSVDKKLALISELFSYANGKEAKYITRTLLGDLRVGIADGILRDSIVSAFFEKEEGEEKERIKRAVEEANDKSGDWAAVFSKAMKGEKALGEIEIEPGKAMNVMLAVKIENIAKALEEFADKDGKIAIEHKYDGFRVVINKKQGKNGEISLFTRRLENVTNQFPDVVKAVEKYVKADSFILDSEVVGYDPLTGKYKPFESISQRIKRKYDIDKLVKELPVEVNVFDVIYYNGKNTMTMSFRERRKIVEKIVSKKEKAIRPAVQIQTKDEKEAEKFYRDALKIGEEGIMIKNLDKEYRSGRRVGYMAKLKPDVKDLDLVITGAEYGSGKRAGWLTSYIVACLDENTGEFLDVGKVSTGLKELENEDGAITYNEMTKLLKPLIEEEKGKEVKVKPKVVVSVTYQNIQKSPSYSSGWAMRFPRITAYRPDRNTKDITTLREIEKEVK